MTQPTPRRDQKTIQARETLLSAARSLLTNRLRSLLTTTGIITGISSVIILAAMGNGLEATFNSQFSRLANQITIAPTQATPNGRQPRNLTDEDVEALRDSRRTPHVAELSPTVIANVTMAAGQAKQNATAIGATENYLSMLARHVSTGRWFTPSEISGGSHGVVIGPETAKLLWNPEVDLKSLIGLTIRLSHSNFRILGILDADGQNDNVAIVSLSMARTYLVGNNAGKLDEITAKSTTTSTVDKASDEITHVLDERHHIREPTDRDFSVKTYTELLTQSAQLIGFLTLFIVAVAAISLFVGGVGVANVMLVSVTERTREIGIRRAVGARRRAIRVQFLTESVMLTSMGGIVGTIAGLGITEVSVIILTFVAQNSSTTFVPVLTLPPIFISFVVSITIGVLAGGYPAHRAALLHPIEALRFE